MVSQQFIIDIIMATVIILKVVRVYIAKVKGKVYSNTIYSFENFLIKLSEFEVMQESLAFKIEDIIK